MKRNTNMSGIYKLIFLCTFMLFLTACEKEVEPMNEVIKNDRFQGVWITNVASDALNNKANIKASVQKCYELGISTIYVVTWNKNRTTFRSKVAEAVVGQDIAPIYGPDLDPLKEIIDAAHALDIKVIAWFEYGFATVYNDPSGGEIIQKYPEWASRDQNGDITEKNKFYWLNPFHPEVEKFIIDLMKEAVENYDLDGIQGDDRLPALPSNGGYDEYTVNLYKSEHDGNEPPSNYLDEEWIQWRADKLSGFLSRMASELRAIKPNLKISMSPSIYPWSKQNYLQDWPKWLEDGLVDEIVPQIYRYDYAAYKGEIDKIVNSQVSAQNLNKVKSGILLKVGSYVARETLLDSFLMYNKTVNIPGEVYFFYEGIKQREAYFKKMLEK